MSDHREVRKVYSKREGRMVEIPKDIRATVDAHKAFKRPAYYVKDKGSVESESKSNGG